MRKHTTSKKALNFPSVEIFIHRYLSATPIACAVSGASKAVRNNHFADVSEALNPCVNQKWFVVLTGSAGERGACLIKYKKESVSIQNHTQFDPKPSASSIFIN